MDTLEQKLEKLYDLTAGQRRLLRAAPLRRRIELAEAVAACEFRAIDIFLAEAAGLADRLRTAVAAGNEKHVWQLLESGADPNGRGPAGEPVLQLAARCCFPRIAQMLIAKGALVNGADPRGNTPLHAAAGYDAKTGYQGRETVESARGRGRATVEMLIRNGGDANLANDRGLKPLDLAVYDRSVHQLLAAHTEIEEWFDSDDERLLHEFFNRNRKKKEAAQAADSSNDNDNDNDNDGGDGEDDGTERGVDPSKGPVRQSWQRGRQQARDREAQIQKDKEEKAEKKKEAGPGLLSRGYADIKGAVTGAKAKADSAVKKSSLLDLGRGISTGDDRSGSHRKSGGSANTNKKGGKQKLSKQERELQDRLKQATRGKRDTDTVDLGGLTVGQLKQIKKLNLKDGLLPAEDLNRIMELAGIAETSSAGATCAGAVAGVNNGFGSWADNGRVLRRIETTAASHRKFGGGKIDYGVPKRKPRKRKKTGAKK